MLIIFAFFSAYFIRPFYKMMLGRRITLDDLESVVSITITIAKSANWFL